MQHHKNTTAKIKTKQVLFYKQLRQQEEEETEGQTTLTVFKSTFGSVIMQAVLSYLNDHDTSQLGKTLASFNLVLQQYTTNNKKNNQSEQKEQQQKKEEKGKNSGLIKIANTNFSSHDKLQELIFSSLTSTTHLKPKTTFKTTQYEKENSMLDRLFGFLLALFVAFIFITFSSIFNLVLYSMDSFNQGNIPTARTPRLCNNNNNNHNLQTR